jgi:hypothetical protein
VSARKTVRKTKCPTGKVAFLSQGEAQRAIDRIATENLQAAVPAITAPSRAYRCRCGAWHLTSQPKRDTRPSKDQRSRKIPRRRPAAKTRTRSRALTLVPAVQPAQAPAPAVPARVETFAPSDPICPARRDLWRRRAEELARLNAEERLRPRRAA